MPDPDTKAQQPIQIDAVSDADRIVVLTPEDEDRFVRSCKWVAEASKLGLSREVWLRELHGLLSHVHEWATRHADRVKACIATQRDDQIAIFVVPAVDHYDFELSDLLTLLDVELAEKFRACPCDVMQSPAGALDDMEHLAPNYLAVFIYGQDPRSASRKVAS
jgi:hypothetical protein